MTVASAFTGTGILGLIKMFLLLLHCELYTFLGIKIFDWVLKIDIRVLSVLFIFVYFILYVKLVTVGLKYTYVQAFEHKAFFFF